MLTPVDLENKEFTKAFRGYDIYEVEEFMKDLITDYEKLYRENGELKEKNTVLNEAISSYKSMEETMQNAILVAQRTAEDIKKNAYERSETIIKDAERKAAEAVHKANQSISNLEKTYLNMQREMNGFKAKMNSLLSTYMQLLSELPDKKSSLYSNVIIPENSYGNSMENTNRFTMPSQTEETSAQKAVQSESLPAEEGVKFASINQVNPVVEELIQKKQEQESAQAKETESEPFSFVKQTVDKETEPEIPEELKEFDVFSDESL